MGTWGYGTWENDTALDYLGGHIEKLKRDIEKDLESAQSKKDQSMERPALAAVAMLRALIVGCDQHRSLPRSKAVA